MITVRRADERGRTQMGWLDSAHTFSFADYYDPDHMHFRALRVINDDHIAAGGGFGTHPHRDMEIVTYVVSGSLAHRDSMGSSSTIQPGEVQRMTAGTGILHSEFNDSQSEPVHLLQIWILPEQAGLRPGYEQKAFTEEERRGRLRLVASRDGRDGSVTIHQEVDLYAGLLGEGDRAAFTLRPGRHTWIQVARGAVEVNGHRLEEGDGAAVTGEEALEVVGQRDAEVLVFDLG
jgi:quercetin 2,3-dioxygenase